MYQSREKIQNVLLMFIDFLCLILSYVIAGYLYLGFVKGAAHSALQEDLYGDVSAILIGYAVSILFFNFRQDFLRRGKLIEIISICKTNIVVAALVTVIIFFKHENSDISRGVFVIMFMVNIILSYAVHRWAKKYLIRYYNNSRGIARLFVVTTMDRVRKVIAMMDNSEVWGNKIDSLAIIDANKKGQVIDGVPVAASRDDMIRYAKEQVVDEVLIDIPGEDSQSLVSIVTEFENMGATVHLNLTILDYFDNFYKSLNMLGTIPVITFSNNRYDYRQLFLKRLFDIVGGLLGLLITVVLTLFLAPAIKLESPGPLFFKQKRVGKNGRYFYIYKFRSMYADAEQRKSELMEENKMEGLMFKMDNDPRITKVGRFIRKTSLDEFPQFYNVLKGDMSLVGTRPPTVDEFKQYETYHKRRLSMKPGITGLWQVSGRNRITDFEDVVRLDLQYIDNWNLFLDFKILVKTIGVVFKGE